MRGEHASAEEQRYELSHVPWSEEAWSNEQATIAMGCHGIKELRKLTINTRARRLEGSDSTPEGSKCQPITIATAGKALTGLFEPIMRPSIICSHCSTTKGKQDQGSGPLITSRCGNLQTFVRITLGTSEIPGVSIE